MFPIYLLVTLGFAATALSGLGQSLQNVKLQNDQLSFSVSTVTTNLYVVEQAARLPGYWEQSQVAIGTGNSLSITNPVTDNFAFFRLEVRPRTNLALFPFIPKLGSGAVSLPDATAGSNYFQIITPAPSGTPPYEIQLSGLLPRGLNATVVSNNTSAAALIIVGGSTNLTPGERRQFDVSVSDVKGSSLNSLFDLRVISAPPVLLSGRVETKAGVLLQSQLEASGEGPLTWKLISGDLPDGVVFSTNGFLSGVPSAAAAERNENGLYTNVVEISGSLADRVTGRLEERSTRATNVARVRLSYELNLHAKRMDGPSFGRICIACHGPGFPPNFGSTSALDIVGVSAGSGAECSTLFDYLTPGELESSLIYRKVSDAPCGVRMPQGGPYLNDTQINRIARWILQLHPEDID